jgi:hypothetical protein
MRRARSVALFGLATTRLQRRRLNHRRRRHGHIEDDGHRRVLSFELCRRDAAPFDRLAHLPRRISLAFDRLPGLGERDGIAERRAPRQSNDEANLIRQFRFNNPEVAIGDRLLLRPAPGITRLPWLPGYEVGEAARMFSSLFSLNRVTVLKASELEPVDPALRFSPARTAWLPSLADTNGQS